MLGGGPIGREEGDKEGTVGGRLVGREVWEHKTGAAEGAGVGVGSADCEGEANTTGLGEMEEVRGDVLGAGVGRTLGTATTTVVVGCGVPTRRTLVTGEGWNVGTRLGTELYAIGQEGVVHTQVQVHPSPAEPSSILLPKGWMATVRCTHAATIQTKQYLSLILVCFRWLNFSFRNRFRTLLLQNNAAPVELSNAAPSENRSSRTMLWPQDVEEMMGTHRPNCIFNAFLTKEV